MHDVSEQAIADFISRWAPSGGSEQANAQLFLSEFCALLELPVPGPATGVNEENAYCFERKVYVPRGDGTSERRRIDLYKRGCFVLEAKQGSEEQAASTVIPGATRSSAARRGTRQWEDLMARARRQAEHYVRTLPADEGRPPFIIVADAGHCFDIYAEFSRSGGMYIPFPDAGSCRLFLKDLHDPEKRELFRAIWTDPLSLDPSRRAAKVTEHIARLLADLARSLEADGHTAEEVAAFLMRCLFSMFAEDVGLLPAQGFLHLLEQAAASPELFRHSLADLWKAMNEGSVSVALGQRLRRFNGNIFANPAVLPLSGPQIATLREAAKADWREVEPAIFGTLLERALDPHERHKLGAHYTPRAYVERLVLPTVIQPLREEWGDVQAAASLLAVQGKTSEAQKEILDFHRRLCAVRVLDPACGSGNFLYVTMEHMKRLEGEVLAEAATYGAFHQTLEAKGLTVDPHQFLGLELNPRAAHIAEMVLWIGYLQWHYRTHGEVEPPEPIIRNFHNIENRDAVLTCDGWAYATDKDGKVITRWDGRTYKKDPVTGRDVPDECAQEPVQEFKNPRPAEWPEADFIVGNPPFIGGANKRSALGDGYFQVLCATYAALPESCDFVMYWWHKAAALVRQGKARRFGFITTNSLRQLFNRRVIAPHLEAAPPLSLAFAIPDHPWVDSADGADVRIAMTVGVFGPMDGALARVVREEATDGLELRVTLVENSGRINADLTVGVNVAFTNPLESNQRISTRGVALHGAGFIVSSEDAQRLGLGRITGLERHIRPYRHGKDIMSVPRGVLAVDLDGLTEDQVKTTFPEVYQWIFQKVKPERDHNREPYRRINWWLFGRKNSELRSSLAKLPRYIVTVETAKHRVFVFLDAAILPDNMLVAIASDDAYHLGVLSSRIHVSWALAAGGRLGVGNDPRYNKTRCFETFPFPDPTPPQKERIRELGERLDAHRKARQALHAGLTMTGMYNVLEALRAGRELTDKERESNEQGLVSGILLPLHDELDAAVAEAYGWPADLAEQDVLARLVALNAERAAEEAEGTIRWLRPEYQARLAAPAKARQAKLDLGVPKAPKRGRPPAPAKIPARKWPTDLPSQMQAVRSALLTLGGRAAPDAVRRVFTRGPLPRVAEILATLAALGYAAAEADGTYRLL